MVKNKHDIPEQVIIDSFVLAHTAIYSACDMLNVQPNSSELTHLIAAEMNAISVDAIMPSQNLMVATALFCTGVKLLREYVELGYPVDKWQDESSKRIWQRLRLHELLDLPV